MGGRKVAWYWPAWADVTPYAGGTGDSLQDDEFPHVYHKYNLAWQKGSKDAKTAPGLLRLPFSVFEEQLGGSAFDHDVIV